MRQRRFLRYSLRSMLVVVLVLSVWLGYMANQAAKQRRAVALVLELGGVAFYDCQKPTTTGGGMGVRLGRTSGGLWRTVRSGGVAWNLTRYLTPFYEPPPDDDFLHKYVDHDWFDDVVHVRLSGPDVTDEQLGEVVDGLPHIVHLDLVGSSITDAGLERLASLKKLETVLLKHCTGVTDDGIARLQSQSPDVQVIYVPSSAYKKIKVLRRRRRA